MSFMLSIPILVLWASTISADEIDWGSDAFKTGDYATALRSFRPLAVGGDALAQYYLGVMYEDELGVPQDYVEASKWHRLSAERGFALGQNSLGLMYKYGLGVSQDYGEALRWFRLAAAQGDIGAQSNLGLMYAEGQGVRQDHTEAVKWFRKAAEQGEVGAQDSLSVAYFEGRGVRQDFVMSYKWASIAAAQGVLSAIDRLDLLATKLAPAQLAEAKRQAIQLTSSETTKLIDPRPAKSGQDNQLAATAGGRSPVAASAAPGSTPSSTPSSPSFSASSTAASKTAALDPNVSAAATSAATSDDIVVVTGCDLAAAHPSDILRPSAAAGVSFAEIDAERVIAECESALAQDPDNPRYQFQLARGLRKAERHDEAADFYWKAANQGFPLADKILRALYPESNS